MILCMDMDAFFASVEQSSNPLLKGRPVAVIGAKERTVVVTSSYEARARGVKTGMSKFEALKVCPQVQLVCANTRKYTYISTEISKFLKTITPDVEVYSIDEAFMDIGDDDPSAIGYLIKSFVKKNFNITCSVGVGVNKLIAKMATGVNKPDGFYLVEPENSQKFIDGFDLGEIWGIGRRLAKRFRDMGVFTPQDLRNLGPDRLEQMFGINGIKLYMMVCGEYAGGVISEEPPVKSIGHSMTLIENICGRERAFNYLLQLSEMVSARARKNGFSGKTLHLVIRDTEMGNMNRQKGIGFFTSATHHIYETATALFDELWDKRPIRLLGISLGNLIPESVTLTNVIDNFDKYPQLYDAIDKINAKYGKSSVSYASVLNCQRRGAKTISPAWRPEGTRNVEFTPD